MSTPSARELGLEPGSSGVPRTSAATLPSGLRVTWAMPDLFSILSFTGTIPDPITAAVIKLLIGEGSFTPETDPRYFHQQAEQIKGMYGIAAAMLVSPKLDVTREWGDGSGVLGRRDLGYGDVDRLYWLFRIGHDRAADLFANPVDAGRAAEPAPAGGDVPPPAE